MKKQLITTFIILFISSIGSLLAQNTDTMYVVKRHVVHDTVYVRDTLRVQDTVIIADYIHSEEFKQLFYELNGADAQTPPDSLQKKWAQTVTFLENRVIQYEQQNISTMDSIKKYGLAGLLLLGLNSLAPAQTEAPQPASSPHTKTESVLRDSPFNGFHFGYTLEADLVMPAKFINAKCLKALPSCGGHAGLEFSYHFANYFGVSAALSYGTTAHFRCQGTCDTFSTPYSFKRTEIYGEGLSLPLKFEFHAPVSQRVWLTAGVGVRLRIPWNTFVEGYDKNIDNPNPLLEPFYDNNKVIMTTDFIDRNQLNVDLLANVGLYLRIRNGDFLRWNVGFDFPLQDFAQGSFRYRLTEISIFSGLIETYSEELGNFRLRSNMFSLQMAYIHTFQKQRAIKQAQPHWNDDKSFYRHEFRFGVSDPLGFTYLRELFASPTILGEPIEGVSPTKQIFTPVFSLDYHYRAAKWFWLGLTTGYNFYKQKGNVGNIGIPENPTWQYKEHHFLIMPSLRFSYLNRPHLTLYSGLAVGLYIKHGREYFDDDNLIQPITTDHNRVFSAFQLTAFGLKAGANHWFGSFEAGFGVKGIVNLGVGYEF